MPYMNCALTLGGVIDPIDAVRLGQGLNAVGAGFVHPSCTDALEHGEREFFFGGGFSKTGPWMLGEPLRSLLDELHLSFCLLVHPDDDMGQATCQVVDREAGQETVFEAKDGIFITDDISAGDPRRRLAERWEEPDDSLPLILLRSDHHAMTLARDPGEHAASVSAYLSRRRARTG